MRRTKLAILTLVVILGTGQLLENVAYATEESTVYYESQIKTPNLGNYQFNIDAHEIPSHETLPIINKDHFPKTTASFATEVDNTAPSATYKSKPVAKVDVVFAIGELEQKESMIGYIPSFKSILQAASNNIDARVEEVETTSIDITNQDPSIILSTWQAWKQYPNDPTTSWGYIQEDRAIQDNEYHCHRQGYRDRVNNTDGDFILEADIVGYEHRYNDFYGLTFRHSDSGEHYAVVWQDIAGSKCGMYSGQLTSGLSLVKATGPNAGYTVATSEIGSWQTGKYWSLKIAMKGNTILVYVNGKLEITWTDSQPYKTGTYGVVAVSHGQGRFKNITLTRDSTKTLGEAISDVSWRNDSIRFIVHATDIIPPDMKDTASSDYQYTITKLFNSNAYLINLGTYSNKAVLDKVVKTISDNTETKGTFMYNNPVIQAMKQSSDWILEKTRGMLKPTNYLLVGEEIIWETQYKDSERDLPLNFGKNEYDQDLANSWGVGLTNLYTQEKILAEKWRYRHKPEHYDNSVLTAHFHDTWVQDAVSSFNHPGQYRVNYKRRDNPFYPDSSILSAFDNYRYWSTDYDRRAKQTVND